MKNSADKVRFKKGKEIKLSQLMPIRVKQEKPESNTSNWNQNAIFKHFYHWLLLFYGHWIYIIGLHIENKKANTTFWINLGHSGHSVYAGKWRSCV